MKRISNEKVCFAFHLNRENVVRVNVELFFFLTFLKILKMILRRNAAKHHLSDQHKQFSLDKNSQQAKVPS